MTASVNITEGHDIREILDHGAKGTWAGRGAAALGLSGEVDRDDAIRVFGERPDTEPDPEVERPEPGHPDAITAIARLRRDGLL
jgi:hypothetical protein